MNRSEAFVAMHEGHKVTHQDFTSREYLHIVNGKVHTEDGYDFEDKFFETDFFQDGWNIYEESDIFTEISVASISYAAILSESNRSYKTNSWEDNFIDEKPWYNQHGNKRSIFKGKK